MLGLGSRAQPHMHTGHTTLCRGVGRVNSGGEKSGAGDGTRTHDNLLGKQGLYQLSYARPLRSCLQMITEQGLTVVTAHNWPHLNAGTGKKHMRQHAPIIAVSDLAVNVESFARHLRAKNLSPRIQQTYHESVMQFASFLASKGMPQELVNIRREHVESFIEDLLTKWKPATANNRFRGLQSFMKWAAEEGEIKQSPMVNMKPPRIPETPPDVLPDEQLKALVETCDKGQEFADRRDVALLRVFIDTGARLTLMAYSSR